MQQLAAMSDCCAETGAFEARRSGGCGKQLPRYRLGRGYGSLHVRGAGCRDLPRGQGRLRQRHCRHGAGRSASHRHRIGRRCSLPSSGGNALA